MLENNLDHYFLTYKKTSSYINFYDYILQKPNTLSYEEWEVIFELYLK